ncbi:hypothetical protein O3M35_000981 [Rhynocoris fuscipes]|uniref:Uncharacterized protein n=1 Tax=Rhynocoris fuscipes TaxID=488301 RepID=A0AAW1DRT8_9HEMI
MVCHRINKIRNAKTRIKCKTGLSIYSYCIRNRNEDHSRNLRELANHHGGFHYRTKKIAAGNKTSGVTLRSKK